MVAGRHGLFLLIFRLVARLRCHTVTFKDNGLAQHLGLGVLLLHTSDKAQSQQCRLTLHKWTKRQRTHSVDTMLIPEPWQILTSTQDKVCHAPKRSQT